MEQKLTKLNETSGLSTPGNVKIDKTGLSVLDYMDAYEQTTFFDNYDTRDYQ